jgi:hypothetical protein
MKQGDDTLFTQIVENLYNGGFGDSLMARAVTCGSRWSMERLNRVKQEAEHSSLDDAASLGLLDPTEKAQATNLPRQDVSSQRLWEPSAVNASMGGALFADRRLLDWSDVTRTPNQHSRDPPESSVPESVFRRGKTETPRAESGTC